MTAPAERGSAYRVPVTDLLGAAVDMAIDGGEVPSRNRLMAELRVGPHKANAIREALAGLGADWPFARQVLGGGGTGEYREAFRASLLADLAAVPVEPEPGDDGPERHLHVVPEMAETVSYPGTETMPEPEPAPPVMLAPAPVRAEDSQVSGVTYPGTKPADLPVENRARKVRSWPLVLLALPAFVAIWSGWVGLGVMCGFGIVRPLPGIADGFELNSAITLPIGVETYAAYALHVWLSAAVTGRAQRFAKWSAIGSLLLGAAGQVAYHLMEAAGVTAAPWQITTAVACVPILVLGMGAALRHLIRSDEGRPS
ncbi:hypothetical protein [Longispora albida]|uniref:hypothetical protein n=1 Tax=Longispora albida TaxID=203523 RepID=UPI000373B3EF|nr:hypothetical protein [Longispora albida]